jgi:BCD family chlorophyll transporter-like MFS transporter
MAVLALGGVGAAAATVLMAHHLTAGMALGAAAFVLIGVGVGVGVGVWVGAASTPLLTLPAVSVAPRRKAAAAALVRLMMIAGFAVTATIAGGLSDPCTPLRLLQAASGVSASAFVLAALAVRGVERPAARIPDKDRAPFAAVLREVRAGPKARRFTIFAFVSMPGHSAQDLILEPFAGVAFAMTPGQSTALAGAQHGGMLRVGLWGAAQAIAFGSGGFSGAAAADLMRALLADPAAAYCVVFAAEGAVFLLAARLAAMAAGASSPTRLVAAQ